VISTGVKTPQAEPTAVNRSAAAPPAMSIGGQGVRTPLSAKPGLGVLVWTYPFLETK